MDTVTILIIGLILFSLLVIILRKKIKRADFEIPKFLKMGIETHSVENSDENQNKRLNKSTVRILFIDDNKFPIIENLKNAGYSVQWSRDIKHIEEVKVVDSHILFVDYKGVGKNLSQNKEGVGICKMLKDKYKKSKYVVLCTGESMPNELLNEIGSVSDKIVSKSLETTDFINIVNEAMEKITT